MNHVKAHRRYELMKVATRWLAYLTFILMIFCIITAIPALGLSTVSMTLFIEGLVCLGTAIGLRLYSQWRGYKILYYMQGLDRKHAS